jgi:ABC-type amino acid transport system permease subunit
MLMDLLIGLPAQRPGGLLLTVLIAVIAAAAAAVLGLLYATVCATVPRASLPLQAGLAVLRGIPLLLLVFTIAQITTLSLPADGLVALTAYSVCHVGETMRGYLTAYPRALREQSRLLCVPWVREWAGLRLPWTLRRSLDALTTHWVDLLKDTGTLTVISIGELTTVARVLSEQASFTQWRIVLTEAALLYLAATMALIQLTRLLKRRFGTREEVTA